MSKNDTIYEMVNERIVAALDKGVVPWRMPWRQGDGPRNIDGYRYRGINVFLTQLSAQENGFTSPYWLTKKQIIAKGGSWSGKSTVIVYWRMLRFNEKDDDGNQVQKKVPMLRYYRVWNLDQTKDVKVPRKVLAEQLAASTEDAEREPNEAAEAIVLGYENGPTVVHAPGRAFWSPGSDTVSVPPMTDYALDDQGEYYSTLFHELGHSTGHKDRLDRDISGYAFSDHERGREELVAEFTAAYLCAESGIEQTIDNSASYIAGWKSKIKEDPRALVVAAGAAQRAADHILGREAPHEQAKKEDDAEAA